MTPPFDSEQAAHQDVVTKTKELINEYQDLQTTDDEISNFLNPNTGSLGSRRRKLNIKIQELESYSEYENACRSLYGV